ncbi:GNAT family N-acetyltransferase [Leuconostoc citreum]|uniref:Acetyltransferase, GNAT family n=1 Tax=Leuconostoc citreum (strain KM20) TaxID=349519 RepID=B1MYY8_LEUCK|nr:N-acetyltransferase [Leuconostoc citreum]ACA82740.1 Acetyltransferase, GNAT family [Leuconostoc citreum KM20]KAF0261257.1 N-acetyltransferase [Leuconostoc citreum]MBA5937896.1 GNAT family N-acetyltransferase [Leuconostoc citreum]MBE4725605.1 GNAT family N-acetyltransferase [Leuconostoc citreum]MCT3054819.1 N-acetyltransferase [Leuconostoc citreum]
MIVETLSKRDMFSEDMRQQLSMLILDGFERKFTVKLFNVNVAKDIAKFLARYVSENNNQLIIAHQNTDIYGCLFYSSKEAGSSLYDAIKKFYSGTTRLKVILFFLVLGYKPLSNETYIEFLVVSNKCRRQGVGTQLIKYCQRQLLTKKLTLYVAAENTRAIKLYQKNNFVVRKVQHSMLSRICVNHEKWCFMVWEKSDEDCYDRNV